MIEKGTHVVIRGDKSGVFAGDFISQEGQVVHMANVRKLYRWEGACAVEQLALEGVKYPDRCRFTVENETAAILDVIQVIPTTPKAKEIIKGVKPWKV